MRIFQWIGLVPVMALFLFSCGCGGSSDPVPPVPPPTPVTQQFLPNMNQWISPLAPSQASFQALTTPWLLDGKTWLAGQGVSSVVSTDGKTLFVLTSGFNRLSNGNAFSTDLAFTAGPPVMPASGEPIADNALPLANSPSSEYVFVYDISQGAPVQKQSMMIPNAYHGMAYDPTQDALYVSSGVGDFPFDSAGSFNLENFQPDNVHIFTPSGTTWAPSTLPPGPELALNHTGGGVGLTATGLTPVQVLTSEVWMAPCAAGVSLSNDGQWLVVANYDNDSVTVFTGGLGHWAPLGTLLAAEPGNVENAGELDLRPGKDAIAPQPGKPGGEYPFWVQIAQPKPLPASSDTTTWAYISSIRDREIDVVNLDGGTPAVAKRIAVKGQPNKMALNLAQTRLYVAEDESDTVDVIDTNPNDGRRLWSVLETIPVIAPPSMVAAIPALAHYTGANTNSVTLTPDGKQLWVTDGNLNSIAVVALTGTDEGDRVVGLIPTGWYPNSVSFSKDGAWAYVINGKSPTGPNPEWCYNADPSNPKYPGCGEMNEWNPQRTKAGLQSFPTANLVTQLPALTAQVANNDRFYTTESWHDAAVMAAVRHGVQHVIFILKENRTYDQILGDLQPGNGDPSLTEFGTTITPNEHKLATSFVTLDNMMATAELSVDGWLWSTSARSPDVIEHEFAGSYGRRGLSRDSEGPNRSVNVALPTVAARKAANSLTPDDPDVLPGTTDVAAPDGPGDEINGGYLWNYAIEAGLTVRNYGFLVDMTCYGQLVKPGCYIPLKPEQPALTVPPTIVAYPANVALAPVTDPYFRGFDNSFPDYYRYTEWEREFDANYAKGGLPALTLVRFMHDHTGNFGVAIDGVSSPETQVADNDYAVGLLVQKIAHSIYKNDTLIFIIEDDSQDGADHVDSHRTVALLAGAYVKQGVLVQTHYTTLDFLRTMEEVLGLPPMNLNDALAKPMTSVFNTTPSEWSFTATPSAYLYNTNLPLPAKSASLLVPKPTHDAKYWARVTKAMDFSDADRVVPAVYNRILWKGLMGGKPYPAQPSRSGIDGSDD